MQVVTFSNAQPLLKTDKLRALAVTSKERHPGFPGVPTVAETIVLPYNDLAAAERALEGAAAIIVEPVAGNMGVVPPRAGFLEGLREITRAHGALLIFDEVITGFRVAYGGAQERYGVRPDLTCLGKIIGGGLPVGAYGGSRALMSHVAPLGPVYQAGTLSGNPVAMAAGLATMEKLTPAFYQALETTAAAWAATRRSARAVSSPTLANSSIVI